MISAKPIMTRKKIKAKIQDCINKQMTPWLTKPCKKCLIQTVCQPWTRKDRYNG